MSAKRLLAPDTNLLAYPTSRRLLHGVAYEAGYSLCVLPEVHEESCRLISARTKNIWKERLKYDRRFDDAWKRLIEDALASSAVNAFQEEMRSERDNIVPLVPSIREMWVARLIARNLPPGVVKRPLDAIDGDPLIIGQSVMFGVTLLSTNNLNTIDHKRTNEWASNVLGRERLVFTPDETIDALSNGAKDLQYRWSLSFGIPSGEVSPRDEPALKASYKRALNRLSRAGFAITAAQAKKRFHGDRHFPRSLLSAIDRESVALVEESEKRISDPVYFAAREMGWTPGA